MLCNGKYYLGCSPNLQVQVSKEEHERIRLLRNAPLEICDKNDNFVWIDDPAMENVK